MFCINVIKIFLKEGFVFLTTRYLAEWVPVPSAKKVTIKVLPFYNLTIFFFCIGYIKKRNGEMQ